MSEIPGNTSVEPHLRNLFAAIGLIWLCMFVIALTGYPNLVDNERRVGGYVLDAVQNGHWLIQRDATNAVASKPPMLTWIAGLVTLAIGRLTRFAIYLPSALGTLGVAWTVLYVGRKHFGWLAGFLAALTYLLSPMADDQVVTARYDGLFAFPVTLAAIAAFNAWIRGRGWTWFWVASAFATLVKGPLGLVLAAGGLVAAIWEWRSGNPLRPRGNHLLGIVLFFLLAGGWFALAYWQMGQPLIDKMLSSELVEQAVRDRKSLPFVGFYEPTLNVLTRYLPWSLLAAVGLWRVWKTPAADTETRRFERFLFCWFFVGLILFSVSAHQRGRLIFPIVPAVALLTGRELVRRLAAKGVEKILKLAAVVTVCTMGLFAAYHHWLFGYDRNVKNTLTMKEIADSVRSQVGEQFPLTYVVDSPYAVQFYLNSYRPLISQTQAVELLRGDAAAFVAVRDTNQFQMSLGTNGPPIHDLLWREILKGDDVHIVSNHPRLEWTEHMAAVIGPLKLRMDGVKLSQAHVNDFVFERQPKVENKVTLSNVSPTPQRVRVRFADGAVQERELKPGETWEI